MLRAPGPHGNRAQGRNEHEKYLPLDSMGDRAYYVLFYSAMPTALLISEGIAITCSQNFGLTGFPPRGGRSRFVPLSRPLTPTVRGHRAIGEINH